MIAAHEYRRAVLQCGLGGRGKALGPGNGFLKRMQLRVLAGCIRSRGDVAPIGYRVTQIDQCAYQTGGAVSIGAHKAAKTTFAAVQRGAQ